MMPDIYLICMHAELPARLYDNHQCDYGYYGYYDYYGYKSNFKANMSTSWMN